MGYNGMEWKLLSRLKHVARQVNNAGDYQRICAVLGYYNDAGMMKSQNV